MSNRRPPPCARAFPARRRADGRIVPYPETASQHVRHVRRAPASRPGDSAASPVAGYRRSRRPAGCAARPSESLTRGRAVPATPCAAVGLSRHAVTSKQLRPSGAVTCLVFSTTASPPIWVRTSLSAAAIVSPMKDLIIILQPHHPCGDDFHVGYYFVVGNHRERWVAHLDQAAQGETNVG